MKKLIRNILNKYGYEIIKIDGRQKPMKGPDQDVEVGKFIIRMPGNNIQIVNYRQYPELNFQLGRLSKIIAEKYKAMTVIDVGANVGDTIAILRSFIDLPVIGIEGDPVSFEYLKKNVSQFSDVQILNTFLGETSGNIKATLDKSGWNTTIIPIDEGGTDISIITLDEVLDKENILASDIKLLKTDVEGYDTIVLRGATETIRKHKPVLFLEYNRENMEAIGEKGLPFLLSLEEYGYSRIGFFDHKGKLLIVTAAKNKEEISYLHNYALGKNNLLGYYDICAFHGADDDIAGLFFKAEVELH